MKRYATVIDKQTGLCVVGPENNADRCKQLGMKKLDVTQSIVDSQWYLTQQLLNDETYIAKALGILKQEKLDLVNSAYDRVCNYGIVPVVFKGKEYYANRCWLGTWQEVIEGLEYQQKDNPEIKTHVRLYEKKDIRYKNITIEDISVDDYKALKVALTAYRFSNYQPARDNYYIAINNCKTLEDIDSILVGFGDSLDEQKETDRLILN